MSPATPTIRGVVYGGGKGEGKTISPAAVNGVVLPPQVKDQEKCSDRKRHLSREMDDHVRLVLRRKLLKDLQQSPLGPREVLNECL